MVAQKMGPCIFAVSLVVLPNSTVFEDASCFKDSANLEFKGKRGIYLWTNKETHKQYLGSSKNLGNRLIEYYRPSYLHAQQKRGSAISRALLKYGYSAFSLSVLIIGPTETDQVYSAANIPDYVVLEQSYLDNYILAYNINRTASSSAYEPSSELVNVGDLNPSYNKKSIDAFVWDKKHTATLKSRWSKERGKYQFFLYSSPAR